MQLRRNAGDVYCVPGTPIGLLCIIVVYYYFDRKIPTDPQLILKLWLFISGATLINWGVTRIRTASEIAKKDFKVGQPTINMAVAILAVAFTIWAVLASKPC